MNSRAGKDVKRYNFQSLLLYVGKAGPGGWVQRTVGWGPVVPSPGAECTDAHEACPEPLRVSQLLWPHLQDLSWTEFELLVERTGRMRVRYLSFRSGARIQSGLVTQLWKQNKVQKGKNIPETTLGSWSDAPPPPPAKFKSCPGTLGLHLGPQEATSQ